MLNFRFVIKHRLGQVTHYQNLTRWVAEDADIHPTWMPIQTGENDIWERMPIIRNNWSLHAENSVNGLIVPPSDVGALVTAVRSLAGDNTKRHTRATVSHHLAEERCDARRNYGTILNLMKRIKQCQPSL